MKKIGFAFVAVMLTSSPTEAAFENGNTIYEACQGKLMDFCLGYVLALADASRTGTVNGFKACIPDRATGRQVLDVVTAYLRNNPQQRHAGGPWIVGSAFKEAFPCPK